MKTPKKDKLRILLIIALVCFIAIPLIIIIFKSSEGMVYDMTDKNVKMDVVGGPPDRRFGGEKRGYGYCLGGDLMCESGTTPTSIGTYEDRNGATHNIYDLFCDDCKSEDRNLDGVCRPGTQEMIKCKMSDGVSTKRIDYGDPEKMIPREPGIGTVVAPTPPRVRMAEDPKTYLPWNILNGYVYFYSKENKTVDVSFSACYLYESKEDCDKKKEESKACKTIEENNEQSFKCLADNGAKIGDPLCCGQDGMLQNTKYNCPSEYPYCVGYKCGETWGKCTTTQE